MSNRKDKILDIAIDLFNKNGCINTSTRHIADALGISVGNLYYYFENKEDIIIALYVQFMDLVAKQLTTLKEDIDMPFDFYNFLMAQMEYEMRYQFFRSELNNLYTSYPKLKSILQQEILAKSNAIKEVYKHQIKYGYIVEVDEEELGYLCANSWVLNAQWEIYWIMQKEENEKRRMFHGILGFLYFVKRYATKKLLKSSTLLASIEYAKKER